MSNIGFLMIDRVYSCVDRSEIFLSHLVYIYIKLFLSFEDFEIQFKIQFSKYIGYNYYSLGLPNQQETNTFLVSFSPAIHHPPQPSVHEIFNAPHEASTFNLVHDHARFSTRGNEAPSLVRLWTETVQLDHLCQSYVSLSRRSSPDKGSSPLVDMSLSLSLSLSRPVIFALPLPCRKHIYTHTDLRKRFHALKGRTRLDTFQGAVKRVGTRVKSTKPAASLERAAGKNW